MSPRVLTAWWDRRSDPARIELYTRWTFHFFAFLEVVGIGSRLAVADAPPPVRAGLGALVTVHACCMAVASSRALDWALDRRERPTALLAAVAVLSAGTAAVVLALRAAGPLSAERGLSIAVVLGVLVLGLTPLTLNLRPALHVLYPVLGTGVVVTLSAAAVRLPLREAAGIGLGTVAAGFSMAFTARFSTWLMAAVWELDTARETQARLAVAEERLRFGRDLHDVLGRNLSVMALKSELAVQLAQRGSAAAVDQMVEVQRIAQESQREVRDVVRGYREADLHTELAGARSVLRAAGIDCRVEHTGNGAARELPPAVRSALGWVVREGMTNVLRHADATRCTVALRIGGGSARLVIENDGVRTGERPGGGSGLAGLRERLAPLGGGLESGPRPDGRFRLTAELPLERGAT